MAYLLVLAVLFAILIASARIEGANWDKRARRAHAAAVEADWVARRQTIHFGTVEAEYYSSEPGHSDSIGPVPGALGLVDQRLVFVALHATAEQWITFDQIRWIGTRYISVSSRNRITSENALIVHYEQGGVWHVAASVSDRNVALARALERETGLKANVNAITREDYGPARAARLIEDVYGRWHRFREEMRSSDANGPSPERLDADQGELYLAPDRLLFNRRHPIHLAQVRRVDVFEPGGTLAELNPFHEDLLRIEYESPEQQQQVIGFLVRGGDGWASAIHTLTSVPYEHHRGRKKKES